MRTLVHAAFVLLAVTLAHPATNPSAKNDLLPPDITRDLKLIAEVESGKTFEAGKMPWIVLTLMNTSKSRAYPIVMPGDGSEMGWRDPYVHFTAKQREVNGMWVSMKPWSSGRCSLFDWNWVKDVVDIRPGQRIPIGSNHFGEQYDFQYPGKVQLVGHYAYRAMGGTNGQPLPDKECGRMKDVPLFELVTDPVELEVVRPLDLRVRVKKSFKVGVEERVDDVIEITVTNTSDQPVEVRSPGYSGYGLDVTIGPYIVRSGSERHDKITESYKQLNPGNTATLMGGGDISGTFEGRIKLGEPGMAKVYVSYSLPTNSSIRHIIRAEAEVPVEK